MLSPQTLERVSYSYRNGYYDGYDGKEKRNLKSNDSFEGSGESIRPFTSFDYEEGYKAGARWAKKYAEKVQS